MQKSARLRDGMVILVVFFITRAWLRSLGIDLEILPLYQYWQYLNVETLRSNLLTGLWYDHAQPPLFNLLLGLLVKTFGSDATAFGVVFKLITLGNAWLLMEILRRIVRLRFIPLIAGLAYILSPATMLYETELFYTSFISLLLLTSVYFLVRFHYRGSWAAAAGIFLPLTGLCLTRSMYHFVWLLVTGTALVIYFRKKETAGRLAWTGVAGFVLVLGWYVKNKIIFGKLSASTWIGMNMARNVYHDNAVGDSASIAAYEPFSSISVYRRFIDPAYQNKFRGLNDRDLLQEFKSDSFYNETNVNYIPVSDAYQQVSLAFVKSHPVAYLENVLQSMIIYFTPGTRYTLVEQKAAKIKWYDVLYSFNLSHFAAGKEQRRIALTVSALPKLCFYVFVFSVMGRHWLRTRKMASWNLFLLLTIGFVFAVSSCFEHYENMRFRFETEPLFLLLAAQAAEVLTERRNRRSAGREALVVKPGVRPMP